MRYEVIQSGSDGNATVLAEKILIDCGVPFKHLEPYVDGLALVLLTHSHTDHFNRRTVRRLAKDRPTLRWAGGRWMIGPLLAAGVDRRNIDLVEMERWYACTLGADDAIEICAHETHHDVQNCCWKILIPGKGSALYATDLGDTDGLIDAKNYDVYFLEANHTRAEIEAAVAAARETGEFSYRIKAAENHLSYEQAIDWLTENMGPQSRWVPMHQHKERSKGGDDDGGPENADPQGDR